MRHRVAVVYTILLFVFVSCQDKPADFTYSLKTEETFPDSLFSKVSIIPLDPSNPLLYVQRVALIDSSFYILAQNGFFKYDYSGRFVRQISRSGRAEQEWLCMDTFFYSEKNKEICLVDGGASKIIHFSPDGDFLYSSAIKMPRKCVLKQVVEIEDGGLLMASAIFNEHNAIYLYSPDNTFNTIVELETVPYSSKAVQSIGRCPISSFEGEIKCIAPASNVIRRMSEGQLLKDIVIPTTLPVPDAKVFRDYENDYSPLRFASVCLKNDLFCGYEAVFETERYLILTSFDQYYTIVDKYQSDCWVLTRKEWLKTTGILFDRVIDKSHNTLISAIDGFSVDNYKRNTFLMSHCREPIKSYLENTEDDTESVALVLYTLRE